MAKTSSKSRPDDQANEPHPQQAKDRPVKVVRIGRVRGNIWANRTHDGHTVYNVTLDRLWKEDDQLDGGGQVVKEGEWRQSPSFGRDDLLLVAKVADLCHTWIYRQLQDRNESFWETNGTFGIPTRHRDTIGASTIWSRQLSQSRSCVSAPPSVGWPTKSGVPLAAEQNPTLWRPVSW